MDRGLLSFIKAEPRALRTRDIFTHMYLLMLAAAWYSCKEEDEARVKRVIKENPGVTRDYIMSAADLGWPQFTIIYEHSV
jgi:hypothetical protein